uniref:Centrosomal protein 350 n=1 Tax=Xiphophorus maculatus TaxID=8083 RepID=M4AX51_XIPMA
LLDSIPISPKKKTSSSSRSRDGQQGDESRGTSKPRGGNQQSPAKSSSRSPLRNATQDSNVRKNISPGFTLTLSLMLIYQRDTRDKQTDGDLDSIRSSALESAEVRYLNDQPVLDSLKTEHKAQLVMDSRESKSFARTPSSSRQGESTPSSSPGSVTQRLENLRRHQPDDKLEKLKERIRRQRQHLEETADKEKSKSCLEKPIVAFVEGDNVGSSSMPAAKIRKVTAAPPAPIYKGFNSAETKVKTPDGKVWKEEEFHNVNRKVYRDISHQFSGKYIYKATHPASWREGQKLVKMVLGPAPKLPSEEHSSHPAGRQTRTASHHHSDPHSEQRRRSRPNSTDRSRSAFQEQMGSRPTASYSPSSSAQNKMPRGVKTDVLSVDIQGILDDLQLDLANTRSRVCRSASPTTCQPDNTDKTSKSVKKRHYDADTVRQYIAQQQEERKRRQAEEKRAEKEETAKRSQRLQELYKKQKEVVRTATLSSEAVVGPVQKRLQETYTRLLLEDARFSETTPEQHSTPFIQMRPMYQPSGESDKENKRIGVSQSPSSSDKSLNEQPPLHLSFLISRRNDLGFTSVLQPDHLNPAFQPTSSVQVASNEHLLSQLLRLEAALASSNRKYTEQPAAAPHLLSPTRMSRIEALKAKATSLSNRIETEARRFAGQGINYGAATSMDVDTVLQPRTSSLDVDHWTGTVAHATENSDFSFRAQKAFKNAANTSYTGIVLPGAGNPHDLNEKTHTSVTNPHTVQRIKTKKPENLVYPYQTDLHDSSAGSISEGPLLSEGSFSEEDGSPPHYTSNHGCNLDYLEAEDYSAGKRSHNKRLFEFQREAAQYTALSPPFTQLNGSKAPWEELNKGSPLSVINIFTKNVQGHVKGKFIHHERASGNNSPLPHSSHSENSQDEAAVYEDDFIFLTLCLFVLLGELQYSPAVLQQRMAAELQYLESIEESIKQLGDVEKLMGVSMAQQESASLTQMLKAKQHRHEQELYELKIKTEREALETKLQLEENRQRVARAHLELQENLATSQKQTLEGLQESTSKMMSQQTEAARYTADAARHIKEVSSLESPQLHKTASVSLTLHLSEDQTSGTNRLPYLALHQKATKYTKPRKQKNERVEERMKAEAASCSIEEDVVTAANDSLCSESIASAGDEKGDTTSVATEYSLKFDESMTEDEIEERSFRSLLPSEAHRRGTMEKKSHHQKEGDAVCLNEMLVPETGSCTFSGGQDSFSQFTMEMVRQYMRDEEVRLQHQSSLLHLRQKALKEKTRTEVAWLEHQKKKLRDKGEDDKMPPIRKKQRGLLLKLQQEQAEIRRLQEANRAARKERQLLLKQQEEIERMRNSTLRLKERLKCAEGDIPPVSTHLPSRLPGEVRTSSPSLSISGSETSSIMQKLKKMRSHMDEKFLTKREQQLMQRRHHAEELLQWKQQLDKEEAEVRRMEKEAVAAWDQRRPRDKDHKTPESIGKEISENELQASNHQSLEARSDSEKGEAVLSNQKCTVIPPKMCSSFSGRNVDYPLQNTGLILGSPPSCDCLHLNFLVENISDQSDIESRIKALREELKKRKIMAHQLKKEQKKRHKERLKAQEATLLKKLENYNNFIEKTKAELNKEPDSTPETTSRLTRSKAPPLTGHGIPQPNHSRTASRDLPEDSPSVVVYSKPESDHLSEPLSRSFFKPESEEEKALSDHRSDIEEELDVEVNSRSEDEQSHHLLRLDSQENLTASERVPPFAKEEHEQSLSGSLDQEELKKQNKIPEAEEAVTLNNITPGTPFSAVNLEASPHLSRSPSPTEHPLSPHSVGFSLNKDPLIKEVEASVGTDGYQEDFESANSSPRDDHISKHQSQTSIPHTETKHSTKESSRATPPFDHQDEEEEIPEEMSQHSGISEKSHHSEKLLELQKKEEDIKLDNKTEFPSHAPASAPPIEDEMLGFHLGDRVLVGGVQPGTLRFKGPTSFANGFWAGVELDKSEGSNNGTYDGVVYFECEESHGIFAPPDKVSHLPDKFELYADTTEDEDSFFDDLSDKGGKKHKKIKDDSQKREDPEMRNEQTSDKETKSKDEMVLDENDQIPLKTKAHLNSQHQKEPEHQICNGNMKDIILDFTDESRTFLIPDKDRMEEKNEKTTAIIETNDVDIEKDLIPTDEIKTDKREQKNRDLVETFADELINNFIKDSFKQCAEIKRAKEGKIRNANQLNGCSFVENNDKKWVSSVEQKDNLPFFLPAEKEELSSPELCNRSESPVFGPSGQEKLAKRLAELELSRELLEDLGDDQDWFDEDFGLSSRRQQQRLKQKEELGGGESQVKTPPRPELPLPLPPKLPEQPAMVVPHSATEVEKMVHSATQEIWETFHLGREGALILEHLPKPTPSLEYLGKESSSQDQEALSISSYKKAVYDLTWEILKEIFAEDPNTDQPQWVKPRQVKSSSIHRVKTSGDISKIQEFVTEEVLKLYGLTQDENQKTDWQKMLKFGRKKRDRVDHILVQELHEEEAQWVNYDEDELFVKIQLADSIFEALLKDTVNIFTLISDKRAKRGALS